MICPNCHRMLPDDAVFCNICGKRFTPQKKKKDNSNRIIIIAVIILTLIATGMAGWLAYSVVTGEPLIGYTRHPASRGGGGGGGGGFSTPAEPSEAPEPTEPPETQKPEETQAPTYVPTKPPKSTYSYINPYPASNEYFYPSNTRYIQWVELEEYHREHPSETASDGAKEIIRYMINEIYARHGYRFVTAKYANYFRSKDWYYETDKTQEQIKYELNDCEEKNLIILAQYETEHGWR